MIRNVVVLFVVVVVVVVCVIIQTTVVVAFLLLPPSHNHNGYKTKNPSGQHHPLLLLWESSSSSSSSTTMAEDGVIRTNSKYNDDDDNGCEGWRRIAMEGESDGVLAVHSVPTFAEEEEVGGSVVVREDEGSRIEKVSYEDMIMPGTFLLTNVLSFQLCEELIELCEHELKFGNYNAGKNNHGALQLLVSPTTAHSIAKLLEPYIPLTTSTSSSKNNPMQSYANALSSSSSATTTSVQKFRGINRRWRVYRYAPGGIERFAPHIDCGFPPSALSSNGQTLIWDARDDDYGSNTDETYDETTMSHFTVLMYLNDDFEGGHTIFYPPPLLSAAGGNSKPSSAVQPQRGSILIFPQAVGDDMRDYAELYWPKHEGSPVQPNSQRPKYVIRSDILLTTTTTSPPPQLE